VKSLTFKDQLTAVCCFANEHQNVKLTLKAAGQTMVLHCLNLWHKTNKVMIKNIDQENLKTLRPVLVSFI
jgi:hypothetical protein